MNNKRKEPAYDFSNEMTMFTNARRALMIPIESEPVAIGHALRFIERGLETLGNSVHGFDPPYIEHIHEVKALVGTDPKKMAIADQLQLRNSVDALASEFRDRFYRVHSQFKKDA